MLISRVFKEMVDADDDCRYIINQGGMRSTKTYSTAQFLWIYAQIHNENKKIVSIVSESMPHLKRGAMRDFFAVLKDADMYDINNYNKSDHIYTTGNTIVEFFSADNDAKLRGSGRDVLFVNECNNIPYSSMTELAGRTKDRIFLDFNPTSEFWVHTKIIPNYRHKFIKSTYKDNPTIPQAQIAEIEKTGELDPNWWRVYGLGEVGTPQDVIFPYFNIVDDFPEDAKKVGYGLDFGYSVDPTALVKCGLYDGELYIDEIIYERGLSPIMNNRTNLSSIEEYLKENDVNPNDPIYCDPSSPLYREELCSVGYNVIKCDSHKIIDGIENVKRFKINVTKRSINGIKELRNYVWMKKKRSDNPDDLEQKPIDLWNHFIDGVVYYAWMALRSNNIMSNDLIMAGAL